MANNQVQKKRVSTPKKQKTEAVEAVPEVTENKPLKQTVEAQAPVVVEAPVVAPVAVEAQTEQPESQDGGKKSTPKTNQPRVGKNKKPRDPNKKYRFFRAVDDTNDGADGRYTGETPKQAASKRFTKFLQKIKSNGNPIPKKPINIFIRESTRNSPGKIYGYSALKVALKEPQILKFTDQNGDVKKIEYKFRNKLKKIPVPEDILKNNKKKSKKDGDKKKKVAGSKTTKKVAGAKTGKPKTTRAKVQAQSQA